MIYGLKLFALFFIKIKYFCEFINLDVIDLFIINEEYC